MASKGKAKFFNGEIPTNKKYSKERDGALENSYFINGKMRSGEWHPARIIDCRLIKNHDQKKKKNENSYEYYIHYEGVNRRMDEWVTRDRIELVKVKF